MLYFDADDDDNPLPSDLHIVSVRVAYCARYASCFWMSPRSDGKEFLKEGTILNLKQIGAGHAINAALAASIAGLEYGNTKVTIGSRGPIRRGFDAGGLDKRSNVKSCVLAWRYLSMTFLCA